MSNRDKFLTEVMGKCWHEFKTDHWNHHCNKCNKKWHMPNVSNPDFSTWEGFGKLWEWAIKQEWWMKFEAANFYGPPGCWECGMGDTKLDCINPNNLADEIYNFLKETDK